MFSEIDLVPQKVLKDAKICKKEMGSFLEVIFKDKSLLSNACSNNLKGYIHCNSKI
jgi:hypothetical protein